MKKEKKLTFIEAEKVFEKCDETLSEDRYISLGIKDIDNHYTDLAKLISDQCDHTIKIGTFEDEMNTELRTAKEFSGSIFKQLEDSLNYLGFCNRKAFRFLGLERIELDDYPKDVLKEALLNALIHRDYSFSGSIIININDLNVEFISLGGLMPGLTIDDIKNGISKSRNPKLVELFRHLKLLETNEAGIRKIYRLYEDNDKKPQIEVAPNTFKLILPNMNANIEERLRKIIEQRSHLD